MSRWTVITCAALCIALAAGKLAADPVVIDPGAPPNPPASPYELELNNAYPGVTIKYGGYDSRWGSGYPGNPRGMFDHIISWDGKTDYYNPYYNDDDEPPNWRYDSSCECYRVDPGDTRVFGFVPQDTSSSVQGRIRPAWGYLQIDFDEPVSFVEAAFLLKDSDDPAHMFIYDYYYDPSLPDSSQQPLNAIEDPMYSGHWIPYWEGEYDVWTTPGTSGDGSIEYLTHPDYTFEDPTILSVRMSGGAGGIEQREGQDICIVGFQYSVDPYYGPVVPEPATVVLLLIGAAGLILVQCRRK